MSVNKTNKPEKQGVKRSISLFILLSMLLVSLSLASCSVQDFINDIIAATEELPEGMVKTRVTLDDGEVIHIAHSENFTQDDIDFVVMLHGQRFNYLTSCDIMSYSLADIISEAQAGIPLFLMHFENPYIITAYLKPNAPEYDDSMNYVFDSTKYIWTIHDVNEDISSAIDEVYTKTRYSYLLYDCTVKKDIANGVEYNKKCKYYLEYKDEKTFTRTNENMLIYYLGTNVGANDSKFLREVKNEITRYEVYIDKDGKEYLVLYEQIIREDGTVVEGKSKDLLGSFYDSLYPHFVVIENLDFSYEHNGKRFIRRYVGVDLDILLK